MKKGIFLFLIFFLSLSAISQGAEQTKTAEIRVARLQEEEGMEEETNNEEEFPTMKEVVVTGTRSEKESEKIPANITIVDQEDIRNSNAKTIPGLLRSEEGIVVTKLLGSGKQAKIDLRGFGETGAYNTLALVDGRRVNAIDLSGVDWTQIPLEQVERIEILRGTGSVLYGDNAVGGVINIITKNPSRDLSITAGSQFGSYGRHKEKISMSGGSGMVGASVYSSYDSTNGYRENSEYRAKDIGGKITFDPFNFLSLSLSGSSHSDKYGLPGSLMELQAEEDRKATNTPFDEAEVRDKYLNLTADVLFGDFGSLVIDFSKRDRQSESWFFYPPSLWVPFQTVFQMDTETETRSITPRYIWEGEILGHKNTFIGGVDLYWSEYEQETFFGQVGSPPPSGHSDINRDSRGIYFNNEFAVLEDLYLSVGARRERVRYDLEVEDLSAFFPLAPLKDTITERESAYSAGLNYVYWGESSVFFRVNRSLRFSLIDEIVLYDFTNGQIRVNTDLRPQVGKHYELGIRHYFTPDIQAKVTLFRMDVKDEIFYNPLTGLNTNHPKTRHQGVELGGRAELFDFLTLFVNYTYESAKFKEEPFEGNRVPAVPKHKGNAGFSVHDIVPGLIFSGNFNWVGSSYLISDQANELEKLDDYHTIDAKLSYRWRWFTGFVGVNNITNEEYSEYAVASGGVRRFYPAPERNWIAGLEVQVQPFDLFEK